jgi:co-chaperonin GroES (HSP10)
MKKVLGPRVVLDIAPEKRDQTAGGIFIPSAASVDAYPIDTAKVVAIGTGYFQAGILIPLDVEVGDTVILPKMAPKVEYTDETGKKLFIVSEAEIAAIL